MSRAEARPTQISVRAYQVGFGDSVLLTFRYAENVEGRDERHVLFDFGSTQWPDEGEFSYQSIVSDLVERTKGKLDVLVVTHRHKDHIAGFAQDQAAAEFAKLKPSLVIRPWTDDPKAAADATEPGLVDEGHLGSLAASHRPRSSPPPSTARSRTTACV